MVERRNTTLEGVVNVDDIEAIKRLKAKYFRTMDTKDWAGYRSVLADDVVMDTSEAGGNVVTGADDFLAFLTPVLSDVVTVHQGHMPEIDITSDTTATGIWALEDILKYEDGSEMRGYGHYHETYVRIDGQWKIASSKLTRLRVDMSGPLAEAMANA